MKPKRGVITLVFDDGYQHILDDIVPLLNLHNMRAVFALALQGEKIANTEKIPVASYSRWLALKKIGHEIAAHSSSHVDLTTLPADQLLIELATPAQKLGATTLVYPGGAYNNTVLMAAIKYYQAARTTRRGFEDLQPQNPFQLKTFNFTRANFSLFKVNLLAVIAWLTNRWLIETYHVVSEPHPSPYAISPAALARHLKFISHLPVKVKTIHEQLKN